MTPAAFRKLALSLEGATEGAHGGHPDFRSHGKVFATLGYPDEEWGMVKLAWWGAAAMWVAAIAARMVIPRMDDGEEPAGPRISFAEMPLPNLPASTGAPSVAEGGNES